MDNMTKVRREKEIIVMGLCLACAVCVGLFAAIRFFNQDWIVGTLDLVLASFSFYVFTVVFRTGNTEFPAFSMAVISVFGTIATIILEGDGQVFWAYPTVALMFYLLPAKQALIVWIVFVGIILFLLFELPAIKLIIIMMSFFVTSFFCYLFSTKMNQQHQRLRNLANEDVLTKVKNRRAFNRETELLEKSESPESAILFDLDKFKQINDYFGHAKGDEVLQQVSQFVKSQISSDNELYRIGGDEFAVLCFGRNFDYAYQLAQKIHLEFTQSIINQEHGITLSMAAAQKETDESVTEWLGRLDSALYQAKKSGRNQIVKAMRY